MCDAEDLYKTLGISRGATAAQIKKAYRQKALATHPDKNPGKDPEASAREFQKVTDAYSVLSDEASRKLYDRTGSVGGQNQAGWQRQQPQWQQQYRPNNQWSFHWNFHGFQRRNPWEDSKVKEAQSYVIQVSTWEHLETVALDIETDRLDRNLLLVLCTPLTEKTVDQQVMFPYPFGGMSTQGIWWEDILLTGKVRYNTKSDIAERWGVMDRSKPTFAFVRRGSTLDRANVELLSTTSGAAFSDWMWKMLQVDVTFVNEHDHAVHLYWIHGQRANMKGEIKPGEELRQTTMLSHEWMVRDTRVNDHKLNEESGLGHWWIKSDTEQVFRIRTKRCMNWMGDCIHWAAVGECKRNPDYMLENCRLSCRVCDPKENEAAADDSPPSANVDGPPGPPGVRDEL